MPHRISLFVITIVMAFHQLRPQFPLFVITIVMAFHQLRPQFPLFVITIVMVFHQIWPQFPLFVITTVTAFHQLRPQFPLFVITTVTAFHQIWPQFPLFVITTVTAFHQLRPQFPPLCKMHHLNTTMMQFHYIRVAHQFWKQRNHTDIILHSYPGNYSELTKILKVPVMICSLKYPLASTRLLTLLLLWKQKLPVRFRGSHSRDRMVVGFQTTYA